MPNTTIQRGHNHMEIDIADDLTITIDSPLFNGKRNGDSVRIWVGNKKNPDTYKDVHIDQTSIKKLTKFLMLRCVKD